METSSLQTLGYYQAVELGCALVERVVVTHVVYDILLAEIVYFLWIEKVRINC
jgi:hypothetical protein